MDKAGIKLRGKYNVIKSTANMTFTEERKCGNTERIINNTIDFLFKGKAVAIIDHVDSRNTNQLLLLRTLRRLTLLGVYQRFSPNITTKVKVTYDSNLNYNILKLEHDTSKSNSR